MILPISRKGTSKTILRRGLISSLIYSKGLMFLYYRVFRVLDLVSLNSDSLEFNSSNFNSGINILLSVDIYI